MRDRELSGRRFERCGQLCHICCNADHRRQCRLWHSAPDARSCCTLCCRHAGRRYTFGSCGPVRRNARTCVRHTSGSCDPPCRSGCTPTLPPPRLLALPPWLLIPLDDGVHEARFFVAHRPGAATALIVEIEPVPVDDRSFDGTSACTGRAAREHVHLIVAAVRTEAARWIVRNSDLYRGMFAQKIAHSTSSPGHRCSSGTCRGIVPTTTTVRTTTHLAPPSGCGRDVHCDSVPYLEASCHIDRQFVASRPQFYRGKVLILTK